MWAIIWLRLNVKNRILVAAWKARRKPGKYGRFGDTHSKKLRLVDDVHPLNRTPYSRSRARPTKNPQRNVTQALGITYVVSQGRRGVVPYPACMPSTSLLKSGRGTPLSR